MMWLEALLSSILVAFAFLLLFNSPLPSTHLQDTAALLQLQDRAALLAEWGADAGPAPLAGQGQPTPILGTVIDSRADSDLRALGFPPDKPLSFCYRWVWLAPTQSSSGLSPADYALSSPECAPAFSNASSRSSDASICSRSKTRIGKRRSCRVRQK